MLQIIALVFFVFARFFRRPNPEDGFDVSPGRSPFEPNDLTPGPWPLATPIMIRPAEYRYIHKGHAVHHLHKKRSRIKPNTSVCGLSLTTHRRTLKSHIPLGFDIPPQSALHNIHPNNLSKGYTHEQIWPNESPCRRKGIFPHNRCPVCRRGLHGSWRLESE